MSPIRLFLLTMALLLVNTATASADVGLPLLLGKIWAIGYALVALGIMLGLIPICFPGRRKAKKKKEG